MEEKTHDTQTAVRQTWQDRAQVDGVTIDAEHSLDLDDAVYIERQGDGWLIQVSVADVGHGVRMNSWVEKDARQKVFTRYFKTGNRPMLPRRISEDEYSLWDGKDRPVLTVSISLSDQWEILDTTIDLRRLNSRKKLSYEAVDSILKDKDHQLYPLLNECRIAAKTLLDSRRRKGALAIYDLNRGWRTTEEGELVKLSPRQQYMANVIVQEFMILANQVVAETAARNNVCILFRNHTAKRVAPERQNLIHDIQQAIADPVHFSVQTLQQRINVVFNRATYSPRIEGHYGLNLPFYTHFTSPIRRYPDLVTHRIIAAMIRDEEPPYSLEELEEIAEHVTKVEREIKIRRAEHFKKKWREEILTNTQSGLGNLSTKDFSGLLKMACSSGGIDEALESELLDRMPQDRMLPMDFAILLFSIPEEAGDAWFTVRERAVLDLTRNPEQAVMVLEIAKQIFPSFQLHDCSTESVGEGHALTHTSVAKIYVDGKPFVSRPHSSSQKKRSQQLATVDLLAQIAGIPLPELKESLVRDEQPETIATTQQAKPLKNCKGYLLEKCMKNGWVAPVFRIEQSGPPHAPVFRGTVVMQIGKEKYQSEDVAGVSKKEAEQLAAASLLSKLPQPPAKDSPSAAGKNTFRQIPAKNYKGELQQLCTKHSWETPAYRVEQSGSSHIPVFKCVAVMRIGEDQYETEEVEGSAKKEAEQFAAQSLLSKIPRVAVIETQPNKPNKPIPKGLKGGNFLVGLNEICQKQGAKPPEYTITQEGESRHPVFTVTCTLEIFDQTFTGTAEASNKKKGQRKAAEQVWWQIAEHLEQELPKPH